MLMKIKIKSFKVYEDNNHQAFIIAEPTMGKTITVKIGLEEGTNINRAKRIAAFLEKNIKDVSIG